VFGTFRFRSSCFWFAVLVAGRRFFSQRLQVFLRSLIVTFATQRLRHQISHPPRGHELCINLRHLRTTGRLHFGLADATDAGSLEIRWPSGERETIKLPEVDRIYTVTESNGVTEALEVPPFAVPIAM
jgi:hypothetical protein